MSTPIGIIGAGAIGQSFARQFLQAGYRVILSNSRGPDSLSQLVKELGKGAQAGTVQEAAAAQVVLLAVPWKHLREALADLPPVGRPDRRRHDESYHHARLYHRGPRGTDLERGRRGPCPRRAHGKSRQHVVAPSGGGQPGRRRRTSRNFPVRKRCQCQGDIQSNP